MRVCMLTYSFYQYDTRVRQYVNALRRRGDTVDVFEFLGLGVPVIVLRTKIDSSYFNDSTVKFFESENLDELAQLLQLARDQPPGSQLAKNGLNTPNRTAGM